MRRYVLASLLGCGLWVGCSDSSAREDAGMQSGDGGDAAQQEARDGAAPRDATSEAFDAAVPEDASGSAAELDGALAQGPVEAGSGLDGSTAPAMTREAGSGGSGAVESCNGSDDDGDGLTDEACEAPFPIADFDVDGQGAAALVGELAGKLHLLCLRADGSALRAPIAIAQAEANHPPDRNGGAAKLARVDVARSRVNGNVAVAYSYWNFPGDPNDWRVYAAWYDANCELVRAGQTLDVDLPNAVGGTVTQGVVRPASVFLADDGRSYFLYEHQTQGVYRVLIFDPRGIRTAALTIPSSTECAGGALTRVLALDRSSGKFAVVCERGARIYRRYAADGQPIDASFVTVEGSKPVGFVFHYFSAALAPSGKLTYVGRTGDKSFLVRAIESNGASAAMTYASLENGANDPVLRSTSRGDTLAQLALAAGQLTLLRGESVVQSFAGAEQMFELDGSDYVYVLRGKRVVRSDRIDLRAASTAP